MVLKPGYCAGLPAAGRAHHLVNRTQSDVVILEIGDRMLGGEGAYPAEDLQAVLEGGAWRYLHKDGSPY